MEENKQLSLLNDKDEVNNIIPLFDIDTQRKKLRCYKTKFQSIEKLDYKELFKGFDNMKVITFSYNFNFIEDVIRECEYKSGKFILGHPKALNDKRLFNKLKDTLNEFADDLTWDDADRMNIGKNNLIKEMFYKDKIEIKVAKKGIDHRKIYLLNSNDGRYRTIMPSANMSKDAWCGDHDETFSFDDSKECYDVYNEEFEEAWRKSRTISFRAKIVDSFKEVEEAYKDNEIFIESEKSGYILEEVDDIKNAEKIAIRKVELENLEKFKSQKDNYIDLIKNVKTKKSIIPVDEVSKIAQEAKKNREVEIKKENVLPLLRVDFEKDEILLNGNNVKNKQADKNKIAADIGVLERVFRTYDDNFDGDITKTKYKHFKILNAVLSSPFIANARCKIFNTDAENPQQLPMYMIIGSYGSDNGKTFIMRLAQKMMSGERVKQLTSNEVKTKEREFLLNNENSFPIFIDEIDKKYISLGLGKEIKTIEANCEEINNKFRPMIICAGNKLDGIFEEIRKRSIVINMNGKLKNEVKTNSVAQLRKYGNTLINMMGTAFYEEYLRRMYNRIKTILNEYQNKNIDNSIDNIDEFYKKMIQNNNNLMEIDILKESSIVIKNIFEEYNVKQDFVYELSYDKDYSYNSRTDINEAYELLENFIDENSYKEINGKIFIDTEYDEEKWKRIGMIKKSVPDELKFNYSRNKDNMSLINLNFDKKFYEEDYKSKFRKKFLGIL